jgi:hypothetical protein
MKSSVNYFYIVSFTYVADMASPGTTIWSCCCIELDGTQASKNLTSHRSHVSHNLLRARMTVTHLSVWEATPCKVSAKTIVPQSAGCNTDQVTDQVV